MPFPERVSSITPLATVTAEDGNSGTDDREVSLGAGIESDRVGPVAQRDADQVVTCTREYCVGWIRWIRVRKAGSAIKIALQHASDIETNALVTIGEIKIAAFVSIQAGRRHHTEARELVGEQTLAVPQIDIESRYSGTWTRGIRLPHLENIEPFDRRDSPGASQSGGAQ